MRVLGLFSGIGGFELGLQRAGYDISAYCEIEVSTIGESVQVWQSYNFKGYLVYK